MVLLNDEYAKRYDGSLLLVYDDTIGSEEKRLIPDGYSLIKDGIDWLGVKVHKEIYKSDRIPIFYKYTELMIKKGFAYVCLCPAEELRSGRKAGIACVHRSQTPGENLKLWRDMLDGKYKEGEATVRLKTDIKHPNPAFRDRVLLRISNRKHPRVENKYHVWPMLEYSWAIDDHELGMTHILRGKDLLMEDLMEIFIWEKMEWKKPEFLHYGMLKLEEAKLSKSKSRAAIESGVMTGWDDPRTWSLQSLRKRGIDPKAVRNFSVRMGMSLADVIVPAEILYAENRKIIDERANRYFAVLNPFKILVSSGKKPEKSYTTAPLHPDFPKRGKKTIPVVSSNIYIEKEDYEKYKGKEVGLMNLFSIKLGTESKLISEEIKMESQKIQWVSEPHVEIKIVMPNGEVKTAIAEPDIAKAKVDDVIQLVRIGFCRVDKNEKDIVLYFAHK
jgi:glutamyl-tRNA synthetase